MKGGALGTFGAQLRAFREAAGFTQEELATIAGVSVHAVSSLERGQRRRPQFETIRALSTALELTPELREALIASARQSADPAREGQTAGSLPLTPTPLVGRDRDVTLLRSWLANTAVRLITLVGAGGVGKTRLALELAHDVAQQQSTRVTFVGLAEIRDARLVARAIAEALGLMDTTVSDLPKHVRIACDGRPTLLVLDNFEQVLDAASALADLLAGVPELRLLITSRSPLHLRGEREFDVQPLGLCAVDDDSTSVADVVSSPAVQLFRERVNDVQPDFRVTIANGRTVAAICRQLDALPLAIELAARWMKVLSADDLLRRLERGVLWSTTTQRDLPERQQTMNATVAWSYDLLSPREREVFRRLGVLPGRFPIEAAAAVVGGRAGLNPSDDVLGAIAALIDKSLLLRAETSSPERPLFRMLETVRAYATLELAASGERDDALDGLVRYCTGEAAQAAAGLAGPLQGPWLRRVREDLESYRLTVSWLFDQGCTQEAAGIAFALIFFWLMRGHAAEGLSWYDRILATPQLPPLFEATALVDSVLMLYMQGENAPCRARLERALVLARDSGDVGAIAATEAMFGHVEQASGNVTAARDRFGAAADGYRALANPWGLGVTLGGRAATFLATGATAEAEQLLNEAAEVLQGGGPWFHMPVRCVRAVLEVQRGHADEAIALMRESLRDIAELQDRYAFVYAIAPLAAAAALKGDDLWAARLLGVGDAVSEGTGITIAAGHLVNELYQRVKRETRGRLGPDRWARAYAAGRQAGIDSVSNEIDLRTSAPAAYRHDRPRRPLTRPPARRHTSHRRTLQ